MDTSPPVRLEDFRRLVLYANGWVTDTEPYYERLEKEGEYYDEM